MARITYHSSWTVLGYFENRYLFKREPVSVTLALLWGIGGIAAGIGTSTTALLKSNQNTQLQAAMNEDLQALEKSVWALKDSLVSLSEVVLKNRRGLDVLFLREGGLCAAFKEECFYADKSGVVTETLDKLKERLTVRQKKFESQQYWYKGWFNKSPWFATLVSTLMGPLIIFILVLTFGPSILNKLIPFMKDRLTVIQALVLTQQYHALK